MPNKAPSPCRDPRCPNMRPCKDHPITKERPGRGTAAERGYDHRWRKYTKGYKLRNPYCRLCSNPTYAVDHIIPVNDGGSFWDENNHQPLCQSHHNAKTARERGKG